MSPTLSVQDVYKAPMTGHQHNGLPVTKGYKYKGRGFDIYDPTDPGHPDYINPRTRKPSGPTQHGTEPMRATGCTCGSCRPGLSVNDRDRRVSRRATDAARKATAR